MGAASTLATSWAKPGLPSRPCACGSVATASLCSAQLPRAAGVSSCQGLGRPLCSRDSERPGEPGSAPPEGPIAERELLHDRGRTPAELMRLITTVVTAANMSTAVTRSRSSAAAGPSGLVGGPGQLGSLPVRFAVRLMDDDGMLDLYGRPRAAGLHIGSVRPLRGLASDPPSPARPVRRDQGH